MSTSYDEGWRDEKHHPDDPDWHYEYRTVSQEGEVIESLFAWMQPGARREMRKLPEEEIRRRQRHFDSQDARRIAAWMVLPVVGGPFRCPKCGSDSKPLQRFMEDAHEYGAREVIRQSCADCGACQDKRCLDHERTGAGE